MDIYNQHYRMWQTSETEIEHHLLCIILNACRTDPGFIFF